MSYKYELWEVALAHLQTPQYEEQMFKAISDAARLFSEYEERPFIEQHITLKRSDPEGKEFEAFLDQVFFPQHAISYITEEHLRIARDYIRVEEMKEQNK